MDVVESDFQTLTAALQGPARDFFVPAGPPVFAARAPGRLDVMGGIADYSGSLVAQLPLEAAAVAAAQRDDTSAGVVIVGTASAADAGLAPTVTVPAEAFTNPVSLLRRLRESPENERWAGYVAGAFSVLRAEGLVPRGVGARVYVSSTVPIGAGVASSAAIEVAAMRALCAAFDVPMTDGLELAKHSQRIENDVVDAPCGIMDQATAALGEEGRLLLLLCQPARVLGQAAVPDGWAFFGVDSGVRHSVGGAAYVRVRVAAFMGYKILADKAGSGFNGYLCNLTPDAYKTVMPGRLPETMTGAEFIQAHGGIFDTVTAPDPAQTYPVRAAAEHAINEMHRVRQFVAALQTGGDSAMQEAGFHMMTSHASYSDCGLGSPETNQIVGIASRYDSVFGARITGGGSGGTVCVLCKADAEARIARAIADEYEIATGRKARIIRGSSPGAMAVPVRQVAG